MPLHAYDPELAERRLVLMFTEKMCEYQKLCELMQVFDLNFKAEDWELLDKISAIVDVAKRDVLHFTEEDTQAFNDALMMLCRKIRGMTDSYLITISCGYLE